MGDLPAARFYLTEALQVTSKVGLLAYLAIALFHYANLIIEESETEPATAAQKRARALQLLTLVQNHPATWHVYRTRAAQRAAELEIQLPPAIVAAAKVRSATRTLEHEVAELN
jgi:hypothetical protein